MRRLSLQRMVFLASVFCVATFLAASAQTVTTIFAFNGTNGIYPSALVQGADGNFYGTTDLGGSNCESEVYGCGTVFRITPSGVLTTLHNFCVQGFPDCFDGSYPRAAVTLGTDGDFYGTTSGGGVFNTTGFDDNLGTIFKIDAAGNYTQLFSFAGYPTDGAVAVGSLVQGSDGSFYGATGSGGTSGGIHCTPDGCGTAFKITPTGVFATLYSFCADQPGCVDGVGPVGGLVQAANGVFYGTTSQGGLHGDLCGTAFRMTPTGALVTLHSFRYSAEGCGASTLIQANDGNFYGTTGVGGAHGGGTFFQLTPTGKVTNLYNFCGQTKCTDGWGPNDGLLQATDGNFYGTTLGNIHRSNDSVIFSITPSGTYTRLYTFDKSTEHAASAGIVQSTDGSFFGGTGIDGQCFKSRCGTVFNLSVGLGPFVKTLPNGGKAGRVVSILGNNLTGTSGVTFNGTPATFTVISSTLIKATVPSGATSGTIQVTTPSATLASNVAFRVLP